MKRNVTETLLKFNEDVFSKHKKCIEKVKVELKKWVIELLVQKRKIEENKEKLPIIQEVKIFAFLT